MLHVTSNYFAARALVALTGSNRTAASLGSQAIRQPLDHTTISRAASFKARDKTGTGRLKTAFIAVAANHYCDEQGVLEEDARRVIALWLEAIDWDWKLYPTPRNDIALAENAAFVSEALEQITGDDLLSVVVRSTLTLHGVRNPAFTDTSFGSTARIAQSLKQVIAETAHGHTQYAFADLLVPGRDWIADSRTDFTGLLLSTALLALNGLAASQGSAVWMEFLRTVKAEGRLPLLLIRGLYMADPVQLLSAAEAVMLVQDDLGEPNEDTIAAITDRAQIAWEAPLKTLFGYDSFLDPRFTAWLSKNGKDNS